MKNKLDTFENIEPFLEYLEKYPKSLNQTHNRILRTGTKLGSTLYLVVPGDDRSKDICIGMIDTPELANWIVNCCNKEKS